MRNNYVYIVVMFTAHTSTPLKAFFNRNKAIQYKEKQEAVPGHYGYGFRVDELELEDERNVVEGIH